MGGEQPFCESVIRTEDGLSGCSWRRLKTSSWKRLMVCPHGAAAEAGRRLGASVSSACGSSQGPVWASLGHSECRERERQRGRERERETKFLSILRTSVRSQIWSPPPYLIGHKEPALIYFGRGLYKVVNTGKHGSLGMTLKTDCTHFNNEPTLCFIFK